MNSVIGSPCTARHVSRLRSGGLVSRGIAIGQSHYVDLSSCSGVQALVSACVRTTHCTILGTKLPDELWLSPIALERAQPGLCTQSVTVMPWHYLSWSIVANWYKMTVSYPSTIFGVGGGNSRRSQSRPKQLAPKHDFPD